MVPETTAVAQASEAPRVGLPTAPNVPIKPPRVVKKRTPGRPRAVRLDAPRLPLAPIIDTSQPKSSVPKARHAKAVQAAAGRDGEAPAKPRVRRMSDISPPRAKATKHGAAHHTVHKVGMPPIHFGAMFSASLRARVKPHWLALAALGALAFAVGCGYIAWLGLTGGLPKLATHIVATGPRLWIEAILLTMLYYIGRSLGRTAIVYGIAREVDVRPVSLGQQLGASINTFGRRLVLDLGFGLAEFALFGLMALIALKGGGAWQISQELQLGILFIGFLALLYTVTALSLSRSLSGVSLTISNQTPWAAAKLGWELFSHRFELIGVKFIMFITELILGFPLAAVAVGVIIIVPPTWRLETTLVVGLLAWLAGALFGAGTAAWWTSLYRNLVKTDDPEAAPALLTGQPAHDARRGPLALVVSLTSFLIAAALAVPWLR